MAAANSITAERSVWIDKAKGLAIFLVVLGHVITNGMSSGILTESTYPYIEKFIYSFHMPLFFFLSGYLMRIKNESSSKSLAIYYLKKITGLFLPYMFFSSIYLSIKCILDGHSEAVANKLSWTDILYVYKSPIGEYWFLYALMFFTVIFGLSLFISRLFTQERRTYIVVAIQFICIVIGLVSLYNRDLIMDSYLFQGIKRSLFYLSYFSIGIIASQNKFFENNIEKKRLLVVSGIVSFCLLTVKLCGYNDSISLRICIALAMIFFVCALSSYLPDLLSLLGRNTLCIYLLHVYFIVLIKILLGSVLPSWVYVSISAVACTLVPLLIYGKLKKYVIIDFFFLPVKYLFSK